MAALMAPRVWSGTTRDPWMATKVWDPFFAFLTLAARSSASYLYRAAAGVG